VDDSAGVGRIEGIDHLDGDLKQVIGLERPGVDAMLQRAPPSRYSMAMKAWPFSSPTS
jgi:hypothetical protein